MTLVYLCPTGTDAQNSAVSDTENLHPLRLQSLHAFTVSLPLTSILTVWDKAWHSGRLWLGQSQETSESTITPNSAIVVDSTATTIGDNNPSFYHPTTIIQSHPLNHPHPK